MDYISREDAIEVMVKSYIEDYEGECGNIKDIDLDYLYSAIKRDFAVLPSADVVEVIRCKECIYSVYPVLAGQMKCKQDGERWVFFDGYCDKAERREE